MFEQNEILPDFGLEKFEKEEDKALKKWFGKYVKGSFLIEMKHYVMSNFPDILQFTISK